MINDVLQVLKDVVNGHLSASTGLGDTTTDQGQVTFLESERVDALDFPLGAVTLLVANLEQDTNLRSGDPYRMTLADGSSQRVQPPLFLNIYVLFVSRFKDYLQGLRYISLILQYFQNHRVLDHANTPGLADGIDKIVMELFTPSFTEQNNLWSLLRTAYLPSLMYRAKMVVYQDADGVTVPAISTTVVRSNP